MSCQAKFIHIYTSFFTSLRFSLHICKLGINKVATEGYYKDEMRGVDHTELIESFLNLISHQNTGFGGTRACVRACMCIGAHTCHV